MHAELAFDEAQLGSPEIYFGALRNERLHGWDLGISGEHEFKSIDDSDINVLYLKGRWKIMAEYAESISTDSPHIKYRYKAKDVYFVAGTKTGLPVEIEITRDGNPLEAEIAGRDVILKNGKSYVRVDEYRLYDLIRDTVYEEHVLQLAPPPGLQAYTFTFG